MNTPTKTTQNTSHSLVGANAYRLAGITLPEIALLGAAGYVLWRNRKNIETFLTDNGIESPAILSGDVNDLLKSGADLLASRNGSSQQNEAASPVINSRTRRSSANDDFQA